MVEELKLRKGPKPRKRHRQWRVEIDTNWPASADIKQTRYFWTEAGARRFAEAYLKVWATGWESRGALTWRTRVYLLHASEPIGARPLSVNLNNPPAENEEAMKKLKPLLVGVVVFLVVIFLAACSSIKSGTVIGKHYEEAYYYTQMICSGYNAQGSCTVWVPIVNHVNEKWVFTLENSEGKTGDISVPKEDYDKIPLGTVYTKPE